MTRTDTIWTLSCLSNFRKCRQHVHFQSCRGSILVSPILTFRVKGHDCIAMFLIHGRLQTFGGSTLIFTCTTT